jgi:DNA-binding CsgD family transcriptional regulator
MREWPSSPLNSELERRIVQLVAQGHRNSEIAELLSLSEWTLLNRLNDIFNKLGISDRLELMLYGIVHGFAAQTASGMAAEAQGERSPAAL